jgi:hypothetical protein
VTTPGTIGTLALSNFGNEGESADVRARRLGFRDAADQKARIPSKLLNKLLQLQGLPHDGILINGHLKPILIPATRLQQSIRRNIAVLLQMSVGLQPLNEQLMLGIKENSSNYYGTS